MKKANIEKRLANAKKRLANATFKTKKARNEAIKKEINHIFKNWNLQFIPKNIFGFQVFCEWKSRGGRGFAHICKLLDSNFNAIESQQVNYINRTWERFSYETAFRVCIFNYVKKALENI